MIGLAFWVDIRSHHKADYAFWIYTFGVIAFWGGLSSQNSHNEISKFIYFCTNLLMIGVGVLLIRRVFVVFGALGVRPNVSGQSALNYPNIAKSDVKKLPANLVFQFNGVRSSTCEAG